MHPPRQAAPRSPAPGLSLARGLLLRFGFGPLPAFPLHDEKQPSRMFGMPGPPLVPRYLWQVAGKLLYHNLRTPGVSPTDPSGDARRQRNMELRQAAHGQD